MTAQPFKSHALARMLLAMDEREVYSHEPEHDVYYPVVRLVVQNGRIHMVPNYDTQSVQVTS